MHYIDNKMLKSLTARYNTLQTLHGLKTQHTSRTFFFLQV